jgi:hypothetical protein
MRRIALLTLPAVLLGCAAWAHASTNSYSLGYAPASPANPLKGFMPYTGSYTKFPYSLEWGYLPLRSLMTGPTNFQWSNLDALLSSDATRGHQTVFRVYLDYPTLPTGIPQYLLDAGLVTHSYNDYGNNGISVSPDYENPLLAQALTNFIAALGARYDGDSRIGFIQLGLLGYWGEWHTYPETGWFASVGVQDKLLAAYTNAFHKTKLLVRWPAGTLPPAALPLGYHDDSFAYDTVSPPSYNFLGLLAAASETNKWLTQPIGGEVRPEVQPCLWDPTQTNCVPPGQGYSNCVALTHASWMLNQGVFEPGFTGAQQNRALAGARQLGYELYVSNVTIVDARASEPLPVSLVISNTGVAPFYYDWPVQLGAFNTNNGLVQFWTTPWILSSVRPGDNPVWSYSQTNHGMAPGQFKLLMRVANPLTNGAPLRFANQSQDADVPGWLTLGQFSILADLTRPILKASTSAAGFTLQVSAAPGVWTVEATTNLLIWTPQMTTNTGTAQWSFFEQYLSSARFYRVVSRP